MQFIVFPSDSVVYDLLIRLRNDIQHVECQNEIIKKNSFYIGVVD